tara:strand:+ start:35 stop:430 length:396 start_codon:yes stop_codon:yes gene_type:complete
VGEMAVIEISLCQSRHEVVGLSGCKIDRGIFPKTVLNIFDFKDHMETIDGALANLPKHSKVIIYLTGLTILTQAFYVWLIREKPLLNVELTLAHYDREGQNYRYYLAETGVQISREYFLPFSTHNSHYTHA